MVKLYQSEWCPYCHRVRETLTELGLTYIAVNVPAQQTERAEVIAVSGQSSVPVLVDGDRVVAGSDDIVDYLRATYPEADDAEDHAAHAAWRTAVSSSLAPQAALAHLRELLAASGFTVVSETRGPAISDRLPDSYVLLHVAIPAAAVKAIETDPTAASAVLLPVAVVPVEGGTSLVVSADPVGQVWLFATPDLQKVQAMVKKRLTDVFEKI